MTLWTPKLTDRTGALYRSIADTLAADIDAGKLAPGTRLPTHRELAERLGVTVGTVTRAYAEAERRGLIGGEVGRGTFVRSSGDTPSLSLEPERGEAGIAMDENWPPPLAEGEARRALDESFRKLRASKRWGPLLEYQTRAGFMPHRLAGARWIRRFGLDARPERIVICAGAQHAMEVAFGSITRPGDTVLTEALTYRGMKVLARRLHLRLHGLPMDGDGLRPDAFEAACRKGEAKTLYCLPNLQNPTGIVMPERRRREIAAMARTYGIAIVEDDVYGPLLEGAPPPLASFAPERTYFIAGTSKLLAPGLRIAYLLAPPKGMERMAERAWMSNWMAAPLMGEIAASWICGDIASRLVTRHRKEAAERMGLARKILGTFIPSGASDASYHLWLPLPHPWRGDAFAARARRNGVSVSPAESFAVGPVPCQSAIRVCLGQPRTQDQLTKGLRRLRETLREPAEAACGIV
ncbi:MAG: PLP-dependent aminotransferase family protein [Planctomycetes bacterium]|nr:PLP-dependent aminotransferase family protein [Planctomycetota bacterium]